MDESVDAVDRISELPAVIIHHIMSYVSTEEVAQTSVLSKRWNCYRTSFPILDFDQICFGGTDLDPYKCCWNRQNERVVEGINQFIKFVDVSLLRFCELKLCMQKFRLSISLLGVKGSSSIVAKLVTTLKLGRCKLDRPFATISLDSLKKLTLERVFFFDERIVRKITSECPLLEDLLFDTCWGLKGYCITEERNLKILTIDALVGVQRIEIAVPSLQPLILQCRSHIRASVFEKLFLRGFNFERVRISRMRLKRLYLGCSPYLEAIEVDNSNLLSFSYENISIPISSINAPCPWEVEIKYRDDIGTRWFLNLKEFLRKSNHIEDLSINVISGKVSFNLDEFIESSPSFPVEVGNLSRLWWMAFSRFVTLVLCLC